VARSRKKDTTEICNFCGRSVAWGSGRFVNRIPDLDTPAERLANGRPYPFGDWICAECDAFCPDCGRDPTNDHRRLEGGKP
jgi:hypothetical protein